MAKLSIALAGSTLLLLVVALAAQVPVARAATGALTYQGCVMDTGKSAGCAQTADGLNSSYSVAVSPDDKSVYVTGYIDDAIVRFDRELLSAPANTTLPSISGTAQVGQQLACSSGSWDNDPTTFTYQWKRNGQTIAAATSQNYTVSAGDTGTTLTCEVTATNFGGSTSATSQGVEYPAALPSGSTSPVNQPAFTPALSFSLTTPSFNTSDRVRLKRSTLFRRYMRTGFKGTQSGYSKIEAYLLRVKYVRTKGNGNATSGRKKLCYKVHRPKKSVSCDTRTTNGVTTYSSGLFTVKPLGNGKRAKEIRRGLNSGNRIRKGKYDLIFKAHPTSGGAPHTFTYRFKIT